jgi:TPR repeat protein
MKRFIQTYVLPALLVVLLVGPVVAINAGDIRALFTDLFVPMEPFTAQTPIAVLQDSKVLPRNIPLKTFDPHRPDFTCAHEAAKVPPITNEAEALFQQGLMLTSPGMWPNTRNWPKALDLWEQAAKLGHWKALMMIANTLQEGEGENSEHGQFYVPRDSERAVQAVEQGMRLGIPEAFWRMGVFHGRGMGVDQSTDREWAFYELAADMGSPIAQTVIGKVLNGGFDNPQTGMWGNIPVAMKMLECAYAQGFGAAAYELGVSLRLDGKNEPARAAELFPRALRILHDGVKWGNEDAAGYLSASFRDNDPLVGHVIDVARADRYHTLSNALYDNPDLRFPNLDKVLPLPPAELPQWNGDRDTLINAAKGVVPLPARTSDAGPLTERELPLLMRRGVARGFVPTIDFSCHGLRPCPATGVWWGKVDKDHPHAAVFNGWSRQVYLQEKAAFPDPRQQGLDIEPHEVRWAYLGQANPVGANGLVQVSVQQ